MANRLLEKARKRKKDKPEKTKRGKREEIKNRFRSSGRDIDFSLFYGGVVEDTPELRRVVSLPRRVLDLEKLYNTYDFNEYFCKDPEQYPLRTIQAAALYEASIANGLIASIRVGGGKTLISLALPDAMDSEKTLILLPAQLRDKTFAEIDRFYSKYFKLPLDRIKIVAYEELSQAKNALLLHEEKPDLIVADEFQAMARPQSARTKRFRHYMRHNPHCRFAGLTANISRKSLTEYAHFMEMAFRKNSPVPGKHDEIRAWANATDASPKVRFAPGALVNLLAPGENVARDALSRLSQTRRSFRNRLGETSGVVMVQDYFNEVDLFIESIPITLPSKVRDLTEQVREEWAVEDEEFEDILSLYRYLRCLVNGFYYKWDWPGEKDVAWVNARKEWHAEVRERLKRSVPGLDSPLLLARAAERYRVWEQAGKPRGQKPATIFPSEKWEEWRRHKHKKPPPTIPVWIDDFVVDIAYKWAKNREGAIIWYQHSKALEPKLAELGIPIYGSGTDASNATAPVIACSIGSQGKGKNLQYVYNQNLYLSLPSGGVAFEQATGRTHRDGQKKDVYVWWLRDDLGIMDQTMESIINDALYIETTQWQPQKALRATKNDFISPEMKKAIEKEIGAEEDNG